jgi:RNA polymerase sigma factor (sigma-70 family)
MHRSRVETTQTASPDDAQLWQAFKRGDKEALSGIYRRYVRTLYNYGTRLTHDDGLIEDCIQDLFIEIWRNREKLADTDSIKYYLLRALRRKIARKYAQLTRHEQPVDEPGEYDRETVVPFESEWVWEETVEARKEHLQGAFEHLSKRQREVLFLRYYENLSHQEIAQVMALTPQSVYNLIHRTLSALKEHISSRVIFPLLVIGAELLHRL